MTNHFEVFFVSALLITAIAFAVVIAWTEAHGRTTTPQEGHCYYVAQASSIKMPKVYQEIPCP